MSREIVLATGMTDELRSGSKLETAPSIANDESPRKTRLCETGRHDAHLPQNTAT